MNQQELIDALTSALASAGNVLAKVVAIAQQWYKEQGIAPTIPSSEGPQHFTIGGNIPIFTQPISDEQIDALAKELADGIVKEKAIIFIRGFISGLIMAGGGI